MLKLPSPAAADPLRHWDLATAHDKLCEIAQLCRSVAKALSGAVLAMPQFEAKVAFGLHIEPFAEMAHEIDERCAELAKGGRSAAPRPTAAVARIVECSEPEKIVAGIYLHLIGIVREKGRAYLADANEALDRPSVRLLGRFVPEIDSIVQWGQAALAAYLDAARDSRSARAELDRWLDGIDEGPQREPTRRRSGARDPATAVFAHTRDYRKARVGAFGDDDYVNTKTELAWVNRDEIDAVETFALVLFDLLDQVPSAMIRDLARLCADEARHAMIGRALLGSYCAEAEAFPVSTIGIDIRAQMTGWDALSQISLFGELGIVRPMRALAKRARSRGDTETAQAFDFICSDETQHLRKMIGWMQSHHPAGDLAEIETRTRAIAAKLLAQANVVGEDFYLAMSKSEISALLGE